MEPAWLEQAENDTSELLSRRIRAFLDPKRSRLRPWLGLAALRNHLLRKSGRLIGNNPCTPWFVDRMSTWGVSQNHWGIRRQLKRMARFGLFLERRATRLVRNDLRGQRRLTKTTVCEFYLREGVYPTLSKALKDIFGARYVAEHLKSPSKQRKEW